MSEENALNHAYEVLRKEFEERAKRLNLLCDGESKVSALNAEVQHYKAEVESLEFELAQSLKVIKTIRKETLDKVKQKALEKAFPLDMWELDEICKSIEEEGNKQDGNG